jgi:hypothetical protein
MWDFLSGPKINEVLCSSQSISWTQKIPNSPGRTLSQNRVDEVRAAVSEHMLVKYNMALSDVHND